jgi:beta-glucosidase
MSNVPFILISLSLFSQLALAAQVVDSPMDMFISGLLSKMSLDEKIGQLNLMTAGDIVTGQNSNSDITHKIRAGKMGGLFNIKSVEKIRELQRIAVEDSRLRIPLLFGMDVIHGYETVFPIPLGLSCSWNLRLIENTARIAATESTANGVCWTFSPMVDICRDPRWGRIAEGSGEDPYLGSQIAKAMVKGYQGGDLSKNDTLVACVKHFALYGASEGGRDYNTTDMSKVRMYNEYFPPYKAAVDAGAGSVMTSFNDVDGIPATGNKWLVSGLLREQWGFQGFVVSDYTGINEMIEHGMGDLQTVAQLALKAGVDMDMVGEAFLITLKKSLEEGKIKLLEIDQACRRILEAKFKLGLFDDPYRYLDSVRTKKEVYTVQNLKVARQAALESFVLLKNQNHLLPLKKSGTIAIVGPLADSKENMPGTWAFAADPAKFSSVLSAVKACLDGKATVLYAQGVNFEPDNLAKEAKQIKTNAYLREEAVNAAMAADVVIAVLGEHTEMSGESASRSNIELPLAQQDLLKELIASGKPVVLLLFTGRPLVLQWEHHNLPAILNVWFGGSGAADAIADVLFGDANPSGKLTVTFPQCVGQIPLYYNHKNTGRPIKPDRPFEKFRSNYLDVSNEPLYPFGFGLSYTNFTYGELKLNRREIRNQESIITSSIVTNTGSRAGQEIVQLYIQDLVGSITRPVKELKGFQKIFLLPQESINISFIISVEDLKFYDSSLNLVAEPGEFKVFIGPNSKDVKEASFTYLD